MALAVIASLSFHLLFFLLSLFLLFVNSLSDEPLPPPCTPFNCGDFTKISSLFTGTENPICGSIFLECVFNETKIRSLDNREYIVKNVSNSEDHSIAIQDPNFISYLQEGMCNPLSKLIFPNFHDLFLITSTPIITVLICKPDSHLDLLRDASFRNYTNCTDSNLYYSRPHLLEDKAKQDEVFDCKPVPYPLSVMPNDSEWGNFDLISSLQDGFVLQWISNDDCATCQRNGGLCMVDESKKFSCHCKDELYGKNCPSDRKFLKAIIGISAAIGTLLLTCIPAFIFLANDAR